MWEGWIWFAQEGRLVWFKQVEFFGLVWFDGKVGFGLIRWEGLVKRKGWFALVRGGEDLILSGGKV